MLSNITITIPGKPIPLQRPRLCKGRVYDSQNQEKEIAMWTIREQLPRIFMPTGKPLKIELRFFMPIPASASKKKKARLADKPHACRPDIDNLIKFYLDVCNGLLYDDDSQIYNVTATKVYSQDPRTELTINAGDNNGSN